MTALTPPVFPVEQRTPEDFDVPPLVYCEAEISDRLEPWILWFFWSAVSLEQKTLRRMGNRNFNSPLTVFQSTW